VNPKKHRSPQQVRTVIANILDEMERHGISALSQEDLRRIIRRCDKELER